MSTRRPSASGLFRGDCPVTDWASIRDWVLDRDANKCQACKANIANEVDHIWPRRLGGTDHIDNLRAICGGCNKAKGSRALFRYATDEQLLAATQALEGRIDQLEAELDEVLLEVAGRGFDHRQRPWARLTLEMADIRLARRMSYINRLNRFVDALQAETVSP